MRLDKNKNIVTLLAATVEDRSKQIRRFRVVRDNASDSLIEIIVRMSRRVKIDD